MSGAELVTRLEALESLAQIPRSELEWLVAHGALEQYAAGETMAQMGKRIEWLWVILEGRVAVHVDRGAGPRRVLEWGPGDVSGMLPYSRMKSPPGDNYPDEPTEVLAVHEREFPEMIRECPEFTAYTVHLMLDRARTFNASALQDEKMISLGKLSAGLAHELNNPASAAVRGSAVLLDTLAESDAAARALGESGMVRSQFQAILDLRDRCALERGPLSPIEQSEREDDLAEWLEARGGDGRLAGPLADAGMEPSALEELAAMVPSESLDAAVRWLAVGCSIRSIVGDINVATSRIHDLVSAMKRFTYMDRRAGPELVELEPSLRDTVRVLASKTKAKSALVTVEVEPDLPPVRAIGSELNQVWLNLIENALDAVDEGGRVAVSAAPHLDRVEVRVVDDGPGIPDDLRDRIFDPFFTTKAPGEGTGLGLDIARRLVRRSGGEIDLESEPGRTVFIVSLAADGGG